MARPVQRIGAMLNDVHRYFDDALPSPLEPRALMPAQFFTQRERRNAQDSIRRLMYAILEDAVSVYTSEVRSSRQSRTFQQTRRWIDSNDRTWIFSFLRICEALDLDPEYIRRGVRNRAAGVRPGVRPASAA
jgi:hypothetical protein